MKHIRRIYTDHIYTAVPKHLSSLENYSLLSLAVHFRVLHMENNYKSQEGTNMAHSASYFHIERKWNESLQSKEIQNRFFQFLTLLFSRHARIVLQIPGVCTN
mmetsp:Transcript_14090/g.29628  ORF Transcript_14090/g.29628 Transcript_14090/m.29628 type:complete len:103 (+) Transcript_14090:257-565(+)